MTQAPSATPTTESDTAAVSEPAPRFATRMRGYDRETVDAWAEQAEQRTTELQTQLLDKLARIANLEGQLTRVRRELRYLQDRDVFVESEMQRARDNAERIEREAADRAHRVEQEAADRAERVEREATDRAERLEHDAQIRAMQMIDRVATESDAMLDRARVDAQEIAAKYDGDLELSRRRLHRLAHMQSEAVQAIRSAMTRFEHGLADLEVIAPSTRAITEGDTGASSLGGTMTSTGVIDTRLKVRVTPSGRGSAVSVPAAETAKKLALGSAATISDD